MPKADLREEAEYVPPLRDMRFLLQHSSTSTG